MLNVIEDVRSSHDRNLVQLIATRMNVPDSMVCLFADFERVLTGLFRTASSPAARIIAGGHVTPEVQLAAHKVDRTLTEIIGVSPFSGDVESVLAAVTDRADIVFVSNPNRVTGIGWTLQELGRIAQAVPDGLLIIDEYYYDFHGISADPLFDRHGNVVILRSPAPSVGISTDAGYLIATPHLIDRLSQTGQVSSVSAADRELLTESMYTGRSLLSRLRVIHDESLRVVGELARMNVHCRITPFNCLLVRVANAAIVGNHLARYKIAVDNLDGYPGLKSYIRVRIESPATNDRLIEAFRRLPEMAIESRKARSQMLRLRRPAEKAEEPEGSARLMSPANRLGRVNAFVSKKDKNEKATV